MIRFGKQCHVDYTVLPVINNQLHLKIHQNNLHVKPPQHPTRGIWMIHYMDGIIWIQWILNL